MKSLVFLAKTAATQAPSILHAAASVMRAPSAVRRFSAPAQADEGEGINVAISLGVMRSNFIGMLQSKYPKISFTLSPNKDVSAEALNVPPQEVIKMGADSMKEVDALIIPGATDAHTVYDFSNGSPPQNKNLFIYSQIHEANKGSKPILGICAGSYYLGTYAGAKLVPADPDQHLSRPQEDKDHALHIKPGSWLAKQTSALQGEITVDTKHHYIVDSSTLPPSSIVQATAPDGTAAVISYGANAIGYTDHPEARNPLHDIVRDSFVEAIRKNQARAAEQPSPRAMPIGNRIKELLEKTTPALPQGQAR